MNPVRLFTTLFCAYTAAQVARSFADQFRYFRILPRGEKTARLLGRWRVPRLTPGAFLLTGGVLIGGLALGAMGFAARFGLMLALGAYFLYFGQIFSLGYVQRKTHLIPLVLAILLLAPGTTADWRAVVSSWPLVLVQVLLVQVYLASGLAKLRRSGWRWADGRSLQAYLLHSYLTYDVRPARALARNGRLCRLLSTGVLAFELFGAILLLLPGMTWLYAAAGLGFHLGTLIFMRINYLKYHGAVYLVFAVEPCSALLCRAVGRG